MIRVSGFVYREQDSSLKKGATRIPPDCAKAMHVGEGSVALLAAELIGKNAVGGDQMAKRCVK